MDMLFIILLKLDNWMWERCHSKSQSTTETGTLWVWRVRPVESDGWVNLKRETSDSVSVRMELYLKHKVFIRTTTTTSQRQNQVSLDQNLQDRPSVAPGPWHQNLQQTYKSLWVCFLFFTFSFRLWPHCVQDPLYGVPSGLNTAL